MAVLTVLAVCPSHSRAQDVLATITVGRGPTAVLYDSIDRKVFVANKGSGTVSVIDPVTNTVTATIPVGEGANALCWSKTSNKLFVACSPTIGNGWVYIIKAGTNEVIASVSVSTNPSALAWCESRNKVYCLNANPGGPISILGGADFDSPSSLSSLASLVSLPSLDIPIIPIPGQTPNAITYNPTSDRIYVSSAATQQNGKVWVINPAIDNIEAAVPCTSSTWELTINPDANRLYASNRGANTVSVVDCATNQRIAELITPGEPHTTTWIPTNKLFVGQYWNQVISYLHGDSLAIKDSILITNNPGQMAYLPATQKLYIANPLASQVTICDARDGHERLIKTLDTGSGPLALETYPDLRRVYVANSWDTTVTVISDELPAALPPGPHDVPVVPSVPFLCSPNPARTGTTVRFHASGFQPTRLEIRNAAGLLAYSSFGLRASAFRLDPRSMPAGLYFCTLSNTRLATTCKLVVR